MSPPVCGTVFCFLIWLIKAPVASPLPGVSRTRRDLHCSSDLEYVNGNICCLNCPAGTRLISHCTTAGSRGHCKECDDGTYTEHSNRLTQCFKCTQCRPDQNMVKACTHTQDTECQCKAGKFCDPDQACEVCRKCLRCGDGEELVRNCTPSSNTECKKLHLKSGSSSVDAAVIVPLALLVVAVAVGIAVCVWKNRSNRESQGNLPDGLIAGQPLSDSHPAEVGRGVDGAARPSLSGLFLPGQLVRSKPAEDECKTLNESLNSSASNSQHSLIMTAYAFPAPPPQASTPASTPAVPQPATGVDEPFPLLVAVNGEESLRKCFEYFEQVDYNYHRRFFRHLSIDDNVIKGKEGLLYEDKIHELLNIWIEKTGREASLNHLLRPLLDLNQRRTAEMIKEKALRSGHYRLDAS